MSVAIITSSAGLVGAKTVRVFFSKGLNVIGVDNDMRRFGYVEELVGRSLKWFSSPITELVIASCGSVIFVSTAIRLCHAIWHIGFCCGGGGSRPCHCQIRFSRTVCGSPVQRT
jgi:hypothetical protein